jgi:hypothetical protein
VIVARLLINMWRPLLAFGLAIQLVLQQLFATPLFVLYWAAQAKAGPHRPTFAKSGSDQPLLRRDVGYGLSSIAGPQLMPCTAVRVSLTHI